MKRGEHLKISDEFSDTQISEEDAGNSLIAREILQEIRNFGVSQQVILKLIELLSLELEDRKKMLDIIGAVKGSTTNNKTPIFES